MPSVETIAASEKVMNSAPGQVSTEPLLGTPGNTFNPPALEETRSTANEYPRLVSSLLPPSPSPNQRSFNDLPVGATGQTVSATLHLPAAAPYNSITRATAPAADWSAQIEQLRSDVFGIAMSVSALSDRLDRVETRAPQGGPLVGTQIASLRSEIETWLTNHLNAAVEHCMHSYFNRTNPATQPHDPSAS